MKSTSPIALVFVGLVVAAFWYDAMVASANAAPMNPKTAQAASVTRPLAP